MIMSTLHLDDKNFDTEVTNSTTPVLVDFWAEWCGPCKMLSPIIDQLSDELQGKMKVAKVNVDEAPELAGKFNVMSIPTLLIFKGGKPIDQIVGAMPKDRLLAKLQTHL
jgi:thioredoxin 1